MTSNAIEEKLKCVCREIRAHQGTLPACLNWAIKQIRSICDHSSLHLCETGENPKARHLEACFPLNYTLGSQWQFQNLRTGPLASESPGMRVAAKKPS
jgi:hypothetical protein